VKLLAAGVDKLADAGTMKMLQQRIEGSELAKLTVGGAKWALRLVGIDR
jgi:hypothetical protein